ncbi:MULTISPECIES: GspH/FimT family pseudopilin [unclassified Ralstonia]|uniref:GspH/FimT family pseudopilin n=1 Tax=unclassified Ralstonia TaxID=209769 RepID=UPI002C375443|nr:Tfp pilus assembly protein FimT/FimU [Ralstonia sp.]HWV05936.1 Tfp pilus assembly protein FimT/FimU [Ralstonia sp.]
MRGVLIYRSNGLGSRGFTLLELLATITVAAVILMLAAPSLNDFMRKQRVITSVDSITSAIGQARSIAIATNSYVTIAPVDPTTGWQTGVRIFSEGQNPNGTYNPNADKLLGQYDAMPASMKVVFKSTANISGSSASQTSLTYSPVGYTVTTGKVAQVNASFVVSFWDGKPPSRAVIINALGRARTCDPAVDSTCIPTATQ